MNLSQETLRSLLKITARRMTSIQSNGFKEVCPIGIIDFEKWEWPQGVGLYGLFKYYQDSGDASYLEYLNSWYTRRLAEGLPSRNVNTMAPMLTLACLAEKSGDRRQLEICGEWAEWIMRDMPRTTDRGLQHIVSGEANEHQLWDDTLYMTVLFLAKMGVLLKRQDYIDESVRQFLVHIKYLFDKKTGLWFHGWTFDGRHNFADALWARGNCWITAGTMDYIEMVNLDGGVRQYLLDTVTAQAEALARFQNVSGMWHTLLDDPNSYVETSATAGFGYGILKGVRLGLLDPKFGPVGRRALEAVAANIGEDGSVNQVSYGTGMGRDLEHYRKIPLCNMAYGQALALLILCEGLKL
jgi:unsaturated rhamnogalacturonyl hydrolase